VLFGLLTVTECLVKNLAIYVSNRQPFLPSCQVLLKERRQVATESVPMLFGGAEAPKLEPIRSLEIAPPTGGIGVYAPRSPRLSKMEQFSKSVKSHPTKMKKRELTPKQLSSVPCPTCGAARSKRCVLNSGVSRSKPHVDRKFAAIEAIERKTI